MKAMQRRVRVLMMIVGAAAFVPAAPAAQPETADQEIVRPTRGLVIGRVGAGGRQPIHTNAIESMIARGEWAAPSAGDVVAFGDNRSREWRAIEADDGGAFQDRDMSGGHLYVPIESDRRRVMLLHVRGRFASMRINGEPRPGDLYDTGWIRLPVMLDEGTNDLLINTLRPGIRIELEPAPAEIVLDTRDATLPQMLIGEDEPLWGALLLLNATERTQDDLAVVTRRDDGQTMETPLASIPPLTTKKIPFRIDGGIAEGATESTVTIEIVRRDRPREGALASTTLTLGHADPAGDHIRTFHSAVDGSVQYYAVRPAVRNEQSRSERPGLTLTLHGASVEATGQRNQYAPREWTYFVAPTNRRPFGFDWENTGRLDAMEVLSLAEQRFQTDPKKRWLTGHSMGGHGTWILGALYPDRFAAIGPSAGWISFWSYSSAAEYEDATPIEQLLRRAANVHDTLGHSRNLTQHGVYILHGDRDDNVPVEQARTMVKYLADFHPDFAFHQEPGAGHWWGAPCCDWPPMFEYFQRYGIPESESVHRVEFVTADPAASASCHWATIEAQQIPLVFSRIDLRFDPATNRISGSTENVKRLSIDMQTLGTSDATIELDGSTVFQVAAGSRIFLEREESGWAALAGEPPPAFKRPERCGPFKEIFRNDVLLVYGTKGDEAENAWALAKARFDAEMFWYRGNGSIDVIADAAFDPVADPDRNVILYGNAQTNAAWTVLLGQSPVQVEDGRVRVGDASVTGDDIGVLFVRPRPGSDAAMVAAVCGTSRHGAELTTMLPVFVSGVAYPDCIVLDSASLTAGVGGVVCAGFFGHDWSVETGDFRWRPGWD